MLIAGAWVCAAPPRVSGNRPVVIEVPVPDAEPEFAQPGRSDALDREFLATVFPEESADAADSDDGNRQRTPLGELKHARQQLLKCSSISAKIVETVSVLEKSYKAEGRYLQTALKPNDWHMRLELVVKIGDAEGSLLEVCDGEVLWMRADVESGRKKDRKESKETTITRRNVSEIMNAARRIGDKKIETALITSFGLGGIPALLAGMEQDMKFTGIKEDHLRSRPVLVIQGTWTESFASKLRGGQPGRGSSALMPPFVPDSVHIYVDRDTGFPHRILYRKKVPGREVQRPMLTLDFLEVALNQPINNSEFDYVPPDDIQPQELTKNYVDQLTVPPESRGQPGAPSK